jgi:hypothetical protein
MIEGFTGTDGRQDFFGHFANDEIRTTVLAFVRITFL